MADKHRVVIVGGGFGGLAAAKELKGANVDTTMIDRRNHHLFQPLLYQVATASLATSDIAWPIRTLLRERKDVRTVLGTVVGIDTAKRTIHIEDGTEVPYDSLILATGARHAYFGHDEWEENAPGLKTLEDATTIRRQILEAFEAAEREADPERRQALLTFVIIGGGPTGVELAGAISDLARDALRGEFRAFDPKETRVVLIEGDRRVLGSFDEDLSAYSEAALRRLGVEVELGNNATVIDSEGVTYGGKHLPAKTIIWAAGVKASPAARWLGAPADKAGRIKVEDDLSVPGLPEVFAIGDTAAITMPDGKPVPGIGDAAKQAGKHAARVIKARLAGDTAHKPFHYKHLGSLATIGKRAAVIDFGWIKLKGWFAWWVWGLAHIYFLIGVKNRFSVALSWLWSYLTGRRSSRLITQGPADEEAPLEEVDKKVG
jgi:NADH dehydrogenase